MSIHKNHCLYCDPTPINQVKILMEQRSARIKKAKEVIKNVYKSFSKCTTYFRYGFPRDERAYMTLSLTYYAKNRKIWINKSTKYNSHQAFLLNEELLYESFELYEEIEKHLEHISELAIIIFK